MNDDPVRREELDRSLLEESVEDLYENAPCGYLSTLPDGIIVRVNATFLKWTGFDRDELLSGKRFQDLLTVGGRIFHETHFAPLLRMQGFVNEVSVDVLCRDRSVLPALISTVQKRGASGQPVLDRITLFNARERRAYERELLRARKAAEQAAREKAQLVAVISHEIRSPLNTVLGVAQLLQKLDPTPAQQKYISMLMSSSQRLLHLINGVLDMSKIESGTVSVDARAFDLARLVQDLVAGLAVRGAEKGIAVEARVDESLPAQVVGDDVKIGQVLTNLLSNAVKFTEQGAVTVGVDVVERQPHTVAVAFSVADTGIGIPRDRLASIFEEYKQASSDVAHRYGGTGLGLSISQKLVEMLGGRIEVESTPGRGSTFSFSLRLGIDEHVPSR